MAVDYTYNALVDLEAIEDYLTKRSGYPGTARKFIERLTGALDVLGEFPNMGTPRDDLRPDIRQYIYKGLCGALQRVRDGRNYPGGHAGQPRH